MSVLLVHLGFAASDEGEQTLLLARALRDAGREALLACPQESPLAVAVMIFRVVPVGLKYTARILLMCVICCMI